MGSHNCWCAKLVVGYSAFGPKLALAPRQIQPDHMCAHELLCKLVARGWSCRVVEKKERKSVKCTPFSPGDSLVWFLADKASNISKRYLLLLLVAHEKNLSVPHFATEEDYEKLLIKGGTSTPTPKKRMRTSTFDWSWQEGDWELLAKAKVAHKQRRQRRQPTHNANMDSVLDDDQDGHDPGRNTDDDGEADNSGGSGPSSSDSSTSSSISAAASVGHSSSKDGASSDARGASGAVAGELDQQQPPPPASAAQRATQRQLGARARNMLVASPFGACRLTPRMNSDGAIVGYDDMHEPST